MLLIKKLENSPLVQSDSLGGANLVVNPLPELRARDFGGSCVFLFDS